MYACQPTYTSQGRSHFVLDFRSECCILQKVIYLLFVGSSVICKERVLQRCMLKQRGSQACGLRSCIKLFSSQLQAVANVASSVAQRCHWHRPQRCVNTVKGTYETHFKQNWSEIVFWVYITTPWHQVNSKKYLSKLLVSAKKMAKFGSKNRHHHEGLRRRWVIRNLQSKILLHRPFTECYLQCTVNATIGYAHAVHTTLQRHNTENSKQIFPEKELHGLSPNFHIHVSVSDLYISTIGLPILLQENMGIYKSLTDTWMWKYGLMPRNSFSVNTRT